MHNCKGLVPTCYPSNKVRSRSLVVILTKKSALLQFVHLQSINMTNASFVHSFCLQDQQLHTPRNNTSRSQDEMIPHELDCIEHLRLHTPTRSASLSKDYRLLPSSSSSSSSPRVTSLSCKRPRPSRDPQFKFQPMHRPSKIQKDDKMLFLSSKGLSAVQFPSLPDMVMVGSSTRTSQRDLSQIPCPKNIRLTPRRQAH